MHALPAQVHSLVHLIQTAPGPRGLLVAWAAGLLLRFAAPGRVPPAAILATLLAAVALALPLDPLSPTTPLARLPGALLLLFFAMLAASHAARMMRWLLWAATAALTAWWLRGAPAAAAAIASVIPVFIGLLAASAVVGRLVARDAGWASIAAAVSLATSLRLTGGATQWVYASLVPAAAGIALLGRPEAAAALAQATTLIAVATIVAFDRGRLTPVDLATAAPLAVWAAAPRLLPRLNRAGPALAASLAAVVGIAIIWAAGRLLWPR